MGVTVWRRRHCFTYLFMAELGLHCCTGFSIVVAGGVLSPVVVQWLLIAWPLLLLSTGSRADELP